jgi:colanic acid biosynthesis glycosyl transferase WcaI
MTLEFCSHMVGKGWDVSVLAGRPHHGGAEQYSEFRYDLLEFEKINGITVYRCWYPLPESGTWSRVLSYLLQVISTSINLIRPKNVDVIITLGPPLLGPVGGWLGSKMKRSSLIHVVYDLYPDIAIDDGLLSNPILISLAHMIEGIQHRADRLVVLSKGFKEHFIEKGVSPSRISIVPVWLDAEEVMKLPKKNAWSVEQGLPTEKFIVTYAGTLGKVSGSSILVEVAQILRKNEQIFFLIVGHGSEIEEMKNQALSYELTNIRFLPFQPREVLSAVLATSDVSVVTLLPGRGRTSVPSKVIGYMASGRAIIGSCDADSDTAAMIIDNNAGVVCPPADANSFADAILEMIENPAQRLQFGASSREAFEREFTLKKVTSLYENVVQAVLVD